MATELELERLVATLVGDATSYLKMMSEAQQAAATTAKKVEEQSKKIEGFAKKAEDAGKIAVGVLETLAAKHFMESSIHAWDEQEAASIRLEAVLRSNGREVESLSKDYQDWASEMQKVTRRADETNTNLIATAESFGLTGDAAKKASKDAISLGALTGVGAESTIRLTAAVAKGDIEMAMMFARMIPQLKRIRDEQQFISTYQKLIAGGWETETKLAGTYAGQMQQLTNAWGDFKEQIGQILSEFITPMLTRLKELAELIQKMPKWMRETGVTTAGLATGALATNTAINSLAFGAGLLGRNLATTAVKAGVLKGSLVMMATYAAARGIFAAAGGDKAVKNMEEQIVLSGKLAEKMRDIENKRRAGTLEKGEFLSGDEKSLFLKREFEEAEKAATALEVELDRVKAAAEKAGGTSADNPLFKLRDVPLAGAGLKAEHDAAQTAVSDMEARLEAAKAYAEQVNNMRNAMLASSAQMSIVLGLNDKTLGENIGRYVELLSHIQDFRKEMDNSIATFGMSADQAKLYQLSMESAGRADLTFLSALVLVKKALEDRAKAQQDVAAIVEKLRTPQENYNFELDRLNKLYQAGVMPLALYAAAVTDARNRLNDASTSARVARQEVEKLDGVLAGSSEAQARIAAHVESVGGMRAVNARGGSRGTGFMENKQALGYLNTMTQLLDIITKKPNFVVSNANVG